jgi:ElaB/YqjD/DUF883 family membrane-anchored ribosome-binding protein
MRTAARFFRIRQQKKATIFQHLPALLVTALVIAAAPSPVTVSAQTVSDTTPSLTAVEQDAMALLQSMATFSETKRAELISQTQDTLHSIDQRVATLETRIEENSDSMTAAARGYAKDMLKTLDHERERVDELFAELRNDSDQPWDYAMYNLSTAYELLYEAWEDLEAQFGDRYSL